jgi:hypothetical protein
VDDETGRERVRIGNLGISNLAAPKRETRPQKLLAGGAMDGSINPAAALQFRVSCVDDRVTRLGGNVADDDVQRPADSVHLRERLPARIGFLLVMVTGATRIAATVLAVSVLVETHDRCLGSEAVLLRIRTRDGPDQMLSALSIGRLEHHLVIGQVEVVVQESDPEAGQGVVLLEDESDLFQTLRVAFTDRSHIRDVIEIRPLHGLKNKCAHQAGPL